MHVGGGVGWASRVFGLLNALVLASVEEEVLLATVAVNVDKCRNFSALKCLLNHLFHGVNLRCLASVRVLPLAI